MLLDVVPAFTLYLSVPWVAFVVVLPGIFVMAGFLWFETVPDAGAFLAVATLEDDPEDVEVAVPLDAGDVLVTVVLLAATLSGPDVPVEVPLLTVVLPAVVLPDDCERETVELPLPAVFLLIVLFDPRPPRSDDPLANTLSEPVSPLNPCHVFLWLPPMPGPYPG